MVGFLEGLAASKGVAAICSSGKGTIAAFTGASATAAVDPGSFGDLLSWAVSDAAHSGPLDLQLPAPWGPAPGVLSQRDLVPLEALKILGDGGHCDFLQATAESTWPRGDEITAHMVGLWEQAQALCRESDFLRSCLGLAVASGVSAVGVMAIGDKNPPCGADSWDEDELGPMPLKLTIVKPCLRFLVVVDALTLGALISSWGETLGVPIRTWAIGSIILSFPTTLLGDEIALRQGVRPAFFSELCFSAVAYYWVAWGTHLVATHPELAAQAPSLFYLVFGECVLTWSLMSLLVFSLVVTTVLSVLANRSPPQ